MPVQQSLLFGTNATVDVVLADVAGRAHKTIPNAEPGKPPTQLFIFSTKESISGEVKVNVFGGKKLDHAGITVDLKGVVGASGDTIAVRVLRSASELEPCPDLNPPPTRAPRLAPPVPPQSSWPTSPRTSS